MNNSTRRFKMKKNRKQKDSVIDFSQQYSKKKPRPHTKAEENDIVIGKVIFWGFIILLPLLAFVLYLASRGEGSEANIIGLIGWIIIFSLVILFGSYLILGVIFKWNHARACARSFIYNARKIDLRDPWTAEEKRESLMMGIFLTVSAIALIVLSLEPQRDIHNKGCTIREGLAATPGVAV